MVKLVDTPDLGSGAARCVGSSPIIRTKASHRGGFFYGCKSAAGPGRALGAGIPVPTKVQRLDERLGALKKEGF